nr:MAG TPA: hypothetical protein [Bacteriophage sp.]
MQLLNGFEINFISWYTHFGCVFRVYIIVSIY